MAQKHPTYQIKPAYREGMGAVVRSMLDGIGVEAESIRFHVDGTVTVKVTEVALATMRAELPGLVEYTVHGNNGEVRITTPETDAYFEANSPVYTAAEREALKANKGGSSVSKAEAEKRRVLLEERRRKAGDLHGIDLSDEGR